jgi:transcriptional regulator with XRE-family HTH domain
MLPSVTRGDDRPAFGGVLKRIRESRDPKPSQRALSAAIGKDAMYVSKLEMGAIKQPGKDAVELLAQALKASVDELDEMMWAAGHAAAPQRKAVPGRPSFDVYLRGDPDLTKEQRDVLTILHSQMVNGNRGVQ